ncbi:MAG TPA: hypothetical protein VIG72_13780, partial [Pontibacter sp.]
KPIAMAESPLLGGVGVGYTSSNYSQGCWRGFATRVLFMVSDLQSGWATGPNYSRVPFPVFKERL